MENYKRRHWTEIHSEIQTTGVLIFISVHIVELFFFVSSRVFCLQGASVKICIEIFNCLSDHHCLPNCLATSVTPTWGTSQVFSVQMGIN